MPSPNSKKPTWQVAAFHLCEKLIDTGYGLAVLAALFLIAMTAVVAWRLQSPDLLQFLVAVLHSPALCLAGWSLAVFSIVAGALLLRQQRSIYEQALQKADEVKERALQTKLPLEDRKKLD